MDNQRKRKELKWYKVREDSNGNILIHVPKDIARKLGWVKGDLVQLRCRNGKLTIDKEMRSECPKEKRTRREGYNGEFDIGGNARSDNPS